MREGGGGKENLVVDIGLDTSKFDLMRVSSLHHSGWSDKAFVTNAIIMRYERDGTLVVIIYSNLVIKLYVAWHDRVQTSFGCLIV